MNQIYQTVNIEIQTISKILPMILKGSPYLFFLMNACSLTKKIDDFNILLRIKC